MEQYLLRQVMCWVVLLGGSTAVVDSQSATIDIELSDRLPHVGDDVTFTFRATGVGDKTMVLVKAVVKPGNAFEREQIAIGDALIGAYKYLERFSVLKTTDGDNRVLTLRITGVQWEDSGYYACAVLGSEDLLNKTMLEVYRKPTTVFFVNHAANSTVILRENETTNFICRVPDVLPIPELQIWLERKRIGPKDITQDFQVTTEQNVMCSGTQSDKRCPLHLSYTMVATSRDFNVTFDDDGKTLTCVAKMKDLEQDELNSTIRLDVRFAPKFVCGGIWNGTVNMTDLRIICHVFANPPSHRDSKTVSIDTNSTLGMILVRVGDNTADYSLKDKDVLGASAKVTQMEFVIKKVSEEHFKYVFYFRASNDVGSTTKELRIEKSLTPIIDGAEMNVSRLSVVALSFALAALFGRL